MKTLMIMTRIAEMKLMMIRNRSKLAHKLANKLANQLANKLLSLETLLKMMKMMKIKLLRKKKKKNKRKLRQKLINKLRPLKQATTERDTITELEEQIMFINTKYDFIFSW